MHKPLSKTELKRIKKSMQDLMPEDFHLIFLLQDVTDPINVGSIIRTADACGVEKLIVSQKTAPFSHPQVAMTARGLERKLDWEKTNDIEATITQYKNDGYKIVALELTESSTLYSEYKFTNKTVLILGNEAIGVYKKILSLCDGAVHIPMFGKGPSLNVNVATAVVAYEIISKNL